MDPEYYQEHARRMQELAETAQDDEARLYLLGVAQKYAELADEAEAAERRLSPA